MMYMNVHNLMEDIVIKSVNKIYDTIKESGAAWLSCDCENCRLDTVSYVLNRIPPKYVISGRGVTYAADTIYSQQMAADIDSLALEGIRIVSNTKRPFHTHDRKECTVEGDSKPAFNFSTFMGSILDGTTFEPVTGATLLLKLDGKQVEMADKTWSNPYTTVKSTKGKYSFWVKSISADKAGISKTFHFSLEVKAPNYEPFVYHFEIPLISEPGTRKELDSTYSLKLKDLVLFK